MSKTEDEMWYEDGLLEASSILEMRAFAHRVKQPTDAPPFVNMKISDALRKVAQELREKAVG